MNDDRKVIEYDPLQTARTAERVVEALNAAGVEFDYYSLNGKFGRTARSVVKGYIERHVQLQKNGRTIAVPAVLVDMMSFAADEVRRRGYAETRAKQADPVVGRLCQLADSESEAERVARRQRAREIILRGKQ